MQKISNTILGRYHVREEIGAGAMGVVYRATDPLLERDVAIKTIRIDVTAAEREEFKKRFFREAKSAARLNHPNIVTVYDAGETGDVAFIAMELLDGRDLRNYISLTERMPLESCAQIVADVARALHYAHAEGVIHRDVKPGNIILLNSGVVKLADFGIASLANSAATQTGQMFGTPKYMAPEQIAGRPADGRTDIFSLGIVLYQLITGVAPFDGDSFSSIMFRVMQEPAVAPSDLVPNLPAGFEYVVAKALAKDPNNRYQNAGQMDLDLRNLALSNDVLALPWGLGGVRKMADAPAGIQPLTNAWDATQVFDRPKAAQIAQAASAAPATPQLPDPLELAAQMDAEDAKRSELARLEEALAAKHTKDAKNQAAQAVQSAAVASTGSFAPNSTAAAPMQVGLAKGVEERRKLEAAQDAAKHANASTVPLSAEAKLAKQAVKANLASAESGKASVAKAADATKLSAGKSSSAGLASDTANSSRTVPATRAKSAKLKLFGTAVAGIAALGVGLYALQHSGSGGKSQGVNPPIATASGARDVPLAPSAAASQPTVTAVPQAAASATVATPAVSAAQVGASAPVAVASAAVEVASAAASNAVAQQDGRLSLAVSPWGEVYVNGQYRGVSPPMTELLLPPGVYQVQIRNSEFTPNEQKVTIEAGKRRRITAKFR